MIETLRQWLRQRNYWVKSRELHREGWRVAWRRYLIQRRIDATPPVRTDPVGPVEIRVLTWRRDWRNIAWALKSFYYHSRKRYPLVIHDGGLENWQAEKLQWHFPDAQLLRAAQADELVEFELARRGLRRCIEYRKSNVASRKVFDFFLLSRSEIVLSIDSDIVFFRAPLELICEPAPAINLYNRDCNYAYSLSLEEIQNAFNLNPPPFINSGLSLVHRESIDFDKIEGWLWNERLFNNKWVTEQTLHAFCSALYGVDFLPSSYVVSAEPGLPDGSVCKHYPGFFRELLYTEGMCALLDSGFPRMQD